MISRSNLSNTKYILGSRVFYTNYQEVSRVVLDWVKEHVNRRVHAANVHMLIEGVNDSTFQAVTNSADLVTPDGMPLVWALKLLGHPEAERVYGPTLMLHICKAAALTGIPIGLYGGTPNSLYDFKAFLYHEFPGIRVACAIAPPFHILNEQEDAAYTEEILASGAQILFVGIGCPKQEWWMYQHRNQLPIVMLGVGAAFDFHTGRVRQAPARMQRLGLEWLFRLTMEPKRLWKRYANNNPRFVWLFIQQLICEWLLGKKGVSP